MTFGPRRGWPIELKRLYWVWADMRSRCRNPNHQSFKNYGGRGITVCKRWDSFRNFYEDMAPRPSGLSLDRIDNEKGYSPENCRWATRKQQNSNRGYCIYVFDKSEKVTLKEYCRRHQIKYRPVVKRIKYRGWPIDKALSIPIGSGKHSHTFKHDAQRGAA